MTATPEELAHQCAVAVLNRNDDIQAVLEYFRQYGALVREAAVTAGEKVYDDDVAMSDDRHQGMSAILDAIREMPLP